MGDAASKKRPWYRLHVATWLLLPIVGAAMVYSGIGYYDIAFRTTPAGGPPRFTWFRSFDLGWPFLASRWDSTWGFDDVDVSAIAVNAVVFLVLAGSAASFVELTYHNPRGRPQLKLGTLLVVVAALSFVLGLARMEIPHVLAPIVVAIFICIAMFAAATHMLERGLSGLSSKARRRTVLLLAAVLFVAAAAAVSTSASEYLALTHWAEDRIPRRYNPDIVQRMSVLPIGLSLACAVYVSAWLTVSLTRRFLGLVR